jgi:purine-binding chemotaxis protein CheW
MEFGILADAVLGTQSVPLDAIQAPPVTVTGIGAEYLKGITGEHVIVLDAEKILTDEKIIVNELVSESDKR